MGLGPTNPLPMRVGGGPSATWKAYQSLRQAMGEGGSAENDRGIDGLWLRSQAKGLAAATSSKRRALMQAFPQLATDALPYYERLLRIIPPVDASEADRRDVVVDRYTKKAIRSSPELLAALQAIDARFSILAHADKDEIVSIFGRAFDAYDPTSPAAQPLFGILGGCTQLPAYSTRQRVRVRFATGYGDTPVPADLALIERAKALLVEALPTDVDFSITTATFSLDITPLGLGALS